LGKVGEIVNQSERNLLKFVEERNHEFSAHLKTLQEILGGLQVANARGGEDSAKIGREVQKPPYLDTCAQSLLLRVEFLEEKMKSLPNFDESFTKLTQNLNAIHGRFTHVEHLSTNMENFSRNLSELHGRFKEVDKKFSSVSKEMGELKKEMKDFVTKCNVAVQPPSGVQGGGPFFAGSIAPPGMMQCTRLRRRKRRAPVQQVRGNLREVCAP
jgi:chromosome segregation ATPase